MSHLCGGRTCLSRGRTCLSRMPWQVMQLSKFRHPTCPSRNIRRHRLGQALHLDRIPKEKTIASMPDPRQHFSKVVSCAQVVHFAPWLRCYDILHLFAGRPQFREPGPETNFKLMSGPSAAAHHSHTTLLWYSGTNLGPPRRYARLALAARVCMAAQSLAAGMRSGRLQRRGNSQRIS